MGEVDNSKLIRTSLFVGTTYGVDGVELERNVNRISQLVSGGLCTLC